MMQPWGIVALLVVLLLALTASHRTVYKWGLDAGEARALERIEKENRDAANAAERWRNDLRHCRESGGVFSFEKGTCQR